MQKSSFSRLAIALALAALVAAGALHAVLGGTAKAHLDKSDCALCHLAGKDVTVQQAGILLASQEVLCAKCHPGSIQVSHPSGFAPRAALPGGYPLDWKGDLTCSTCHEVHGSGPGLMRGGRLGKALCLTCHLPSFFSAMRDGGSSLLSGHLAKGIDSAAPALDAYSRTCMKCHGETAVPRLATSIDRFGVVRHASQTVNHPVGMNYQKAVAFGGYRPRAVVERRLLLPGGVVSCVSCHAGFQKDHGKLVLPMARSQLCFECHDL
jgi:predicted CXXCH cytochrome family protein